MRKCEKVQWAILFFTHFLPNQCCDTNDKQFFFDTERRRYLEVFGSHWKDQSDESLLAYIVVVGIVVIGWLQMYILSREPPSQSSAEDLPPAETFRATVTTTGSAESLVFCCTVMNNTSKPEKSLSAYETRVKLSSTQSSLSLLDSWCVELHFKLQCRISQSWWQTYFIYIKSYFIVLFLLNML